MIRILIDECLPIRLRHLLSGHDARTVTFMAWKGLENGVLLEAAERGGFDVLLTCDGNMYKQVDLRGRSIAVVVVPTNDLIKLTQMIATVLHAISKVKPGEYLTVADTADC